MEEKKITLFESIIAVMICGMADLAEFIITLAADLGGAGEFIKWFINFFVFVTVGFWLYLRGIRGIWFYAGSLIELIPIFNAFPTRTIVILITIKTANSEKLRSVSQTLETGKSVAGAVKKFTGIK